VVLSDSASPTVRFAAIGECMVEMRALEGQTYQMAFGGDTANTAVYLVRLLGGGQTAVDYISALGDDPYSLEIRQFLQAEGVGTDGIRCLAGRMPGLYFIRTDETGERQFSYFRGQAAARNMFSGDGGERLLDTLADYDWLYLTGITLSILDNEQRQKLRAALSNFRDRGGHVVFDGNYRPAGWADADEAREAFSPFLALSEMALVTIDDERAVYGEGAPHIHAARLHDIGIGEVVVKMGPAGCLVSGDETWEMVATDPVSCPLDTTAAGDAFNAAYIAARIKGRTPVKAARCGNRLAGIVIQHQGGIMTSDGVGRLKLADLQTP